MQRFGTSLVIDGTEFGAKVAKGLTWHQRQMDTLRATPSHPFSHAPSKPQSHWDRVEKAFTEKNATTYETAVMGVLTKINASQVGEALLRAIDRTPSWTQIWPYLPSDQDWNNGSNLVHYPILATRKGQTVAGRGPDADGKWRKGRGAGSNSTLRFITADLARKIRQTPGELPVRSGYEAPDEGTLRNEDELLVHELTHALRGQVGVYDRRSVPGQKRYDNFEEFYAFLITNVYRSELARPKMRDDNHGAMTEQEVIRNGKFLRTENNRRHLRQFRRDHPILFAQIKEVKAQFNPFRRMIG